MRQRKLYHPLWTHLPAAGLLAFVIYRFVAAVPLPDRVPLHFDFAGNPNQWGSAWALLGLVVGLGTLYLGMSILADELWARQEGRKTFNWLSVIDEAVIAFFAVTTAGYGDFRHAVTVPGWTMIAALIAASVIFASVLEYIRPFVPHENRYQPEDTSRLEAEIGAFVEEGKPWVYWESQNAAYLNWIKVAAVILWLYGAYLSFTQARPGPMIAGLVALALLFVDGGLRVTVTPERLQVRMGIIPVLSLRLAELTSVQVHEFSPLRDFGGYGIRINRRMKAYYLRGNRGVLVETERDKKYLIGSDHPERLAAVLDVARRMAGG